MRTEWDVLCRLTDPSTPASLPTEAGSVDWNLVAERAEAHGLSGQLAMAFETTEDVTEETAEAVPAEVRTAVGTAAREQTMYGLGLTDGLYDVFDRLRSESLPALAYKGPVLSTIVDGSPGVRQYGDLDVLVPPERFDEARALLETAGYRPVERLRGLGEVLLEDIDSVTVDLHRSILPRYVPTALPFEELWERRTTVDIGSGPVPALDPADRMLVLSVHGTKHCWYRLAWIRDVAALLGDGHGDHDSLRQRASDRNCLRHLLVACWLAQRVYAVSPPEWVSTAIADDRTVERIGERIVERLRGEPVTPPSDREQFRIQWRALSGWKARLRYAARLSTIPSREDVESIYLPRPLAPLYRVVRPTRLAARAGRRGYELAVATVR